MAGFFTVLRLVLNFYSVRGRFLYSMTQSSSLFCSLFTSFCDGNGGKREVLEYFFAVQGFRGKTPE
jgi:hypothetical protein